MAGLWGQGFDVNRLSVYGCCGGPLSGGGTGGPGVSEGAGVARICEEKSSLVGNERWQNSVNFEEARNQPRSREVAV
jgi:hypothetical protein